MEFVTTSRIQLNQASEQTRSNNLLQWAKFYVDASFFTNALKKTERAAFVHGRSCSFFPLLIWCVFVRYALVSYLELFQTTREGRDCVLQFTRKFSVICNERDRSYIYMHSKSSSLLYNPTKLSRQERALVFLIHMVDFNSDPIEAPICAILLPPHRETSFAS